MPARAHIRPIPVASGVAVGLLGLATGLAALRTSLPGAPSGAVLIADLAVGWSFAAIGVLLWLRYPESRIGALSVLVGLASFLADIRWFGSDMAWTFGAVLIDAHLVVLAWVLLAFPTGRLDRRETFALSSIGGYYLLLAIVGHLFEDPVPGCADCPDNLLLIRSDPVLSDRIWGVGQIVNLAFVALLVWMIVRKWRMASSAARRGLAPVVWALWPIGTVLALAFLDPMLGFSEPVARAVLVAERLALVAFPIALVVGMLRSRLDQARVGDLARRLESVVGSSELEEAIGETLGDPTVRLGFWAESGELIDVGGRPLETGADRRSVSIESAAGEPIGVVVCDPAVETSLVEAVAATASLALRNESLRAELRRRLLEVEESRGRISEAAVAERRRIERNLHDGAQQSLLALGATLGSIRAQAEGESQVMLGAAIDDLRVIIDDLRELARGVHPAILTERGLGPALEALAERSAVPVSLDVTAERCRSAAEAAAYFFVAEALANATRYADAEEVEVTVAIDDGRMFVRVADDGAGGAEARPGSGLTGIEDRFAALGGDVTIRSPLGSGTILEGVLPCE